MKALAPIFLLLFATFVLAQSPPEKPAVDFRLLYVDRPPTAQEVAAAEASDKPLEPTVYFLAPKADEKGKAEFVPLFLPFSRLANPISLPSGTPLQLFSKPEATAKIAEINPGQSVRVIAVLRASRDQNFANAKVEILDASETGFPFGQMRAINLSDKPVAIKTLDPVLTVQPGGTLTFKPTLARRNSVPVLAGFQSKGQWQEFHSGAAKLYDTNRIILLITGFSENGGRPTLEYLYESKGG